MLNLIDAFLPRPKAATVQTLGHPAAGVIDWLDPGANQSGQIVNSHTALTYSAVWCATRVIAETLATLPCVLYRRTANDSRERATDDPRYQLMHDRPHPAITPVAFFESLTAHMVLTGNCYARIVTGQDGLPAMLEPRMPEKVRIVADGNTIRYELMDPAEQISFEDMLHVAGLGGDGIKGWSVISMASQSVGAAMAAEERAATQHRTNAMPGGALVHPSRLSADARESLRREWNEIHGGSKNAGRVAVLHGGMDFRPFTMSNDDMQFLESRQFSIREIARWFRLPPHMLADLQDSSVRANIEQQAIEFIVYSLGPWLRRWEQTLNRQLLRPEERGSLYFEFLLDALLRGDIQSRYTAFSTARQWGWLSVNDIRKAENMNSIPGGDVYLQPVNMVPAGTTPAAIQTDMQANLSQSLQEIREQSQAIAESLASGNQSVLDRIAASESRLESLRSDREEIKAEIAEVRKVQAMGIDLAAERRKLDAERMRVALKIERAAVIKAAKNQQHSKVPFLPWLDEWYSNQTNMPESWRAESKRQLLEACDGDPASFVMRIQKTIDTWESRIHDT